MKELEKLIIEYMHERGWVGQDPADIAKSIVIEAAELLEHYQWDNTNSAKGNILTKKDKDEIGSEVADIFIYLIQFCLENDIDLLEVTRKKMEHNEKKFPAKTMKEGGHEGYLKAKKEYRKNKE